MNSRKVGFKFNLQLIFNLITAKSVSSMAFLSPTVREMNCLIAGSCDFH